MTALLSLSMLLKLRLTAVTVLQAKRIAALTRQQQELCQQLMAAQVSSNGNAVSAAQHKEAATAAQLRCEALSAQCTELEAIAAAAAQEAAGVACLAAGASWKEGLAGRDATLMRYWDRHLAPLLHETVGDAHEQLQALTREVCSGAKKADIGAGFTHPFGFVARELVHPCSS
jgi:hypothetical protein